MSFVFAEKYKACWSETERLDIHSDTRVVKESISGAHFSAKQRSFIEQYEIVKSTIIGPDTISHLKHIYYPLSGSNAMNGMFGEISDSITKASNNSFQRWKHFILETTFP